jgi:hypothetical protein
MWRALGFLYDFQDGLPQAFFAVAQSQGLQRDKACPALGPWAGLEQARLSSISASPASQMTEEKSRFFPFCLRELDLGSKRARPAAHWQPKSPLPGRNGMWIKTASRAAHSLSGGY